MKLEELDRRYLLYGALSALNNRTQAVEDGGFPELTMKQHFLLVCVNLFEADHPTLKEAGDLVGCSYQNVKRLAMQLEKKGYLEIRPDPADRRKSRLVPTGKFDEGSAENVALAESFMELLYRGISDEALEVTARTVLRMIENLKEK